MKRIRLQADSGVASALLSSTYMVYACVGYFSLPCSPLEIGSSNGAVAP
ncbi:MAG: hypothetical protein WC007_03360 [Pelobacteraceae bacterium]